MGLFGDSDEIENKGSNTVSVTNAIVLDHNDVFYLIYFIAFVKLIELLFKIYSSIQHKAKRRYAMSQANGLDKI